MKKKKKEKETNTFSICKGLIGKDPDVGKIEGRRRREQQRLDGWMASLIRWT